MSKNTASPVEGCVAERVGGFTHLDLFSGIGGFALAASWAGFRTVGFVECDDFCRRVLAKNFPGVEIHGDIREFDGKPFRGVDLVTGGPPCPEFSQANKYAKGFDSERGQMVLEYLRVAAECGAAYCVLENSARIVTTYRAEFMAAFAAHGFSAAPLVVGAEALHSRKRGVYIANPHKVGSIEELHKVAAMVPDGSGDDSLAESDGLLFLLRDDADPVFLAEGDGEGLASPVFCREADGIPHRVDRVGALGNAIDPTAFHPILAAIANQLSNESVPLLSGGIK